MVAPGKTRGLIFVIDLSSDTRTALHQFLWNGWQLLLESKWLNRMLGNGSIFIGLWKSPGIDRFHPTHRRNLQASCYRQELKPRLGKSNARSLLLFSLSLYFERWVLRYCTFFPKWEPSARAMTVPFIRQRQFPPNPWPEEVSSMGSLFITTWQITLRKPHFTLLVPMRVIRAAFDPFLPNPCTL